MRDSQSEKEADGQRERDRQTETDREMVKRERKTEGGVGGEGDVDKVAFSKTRASELAVAASSLDPLSAPPPPSQTLFLSLASAPSLA